MKKTANRKEYMKEYNKKYRLDNPEYMKEYNKKEQSLSIHKNLDLLLAAFEIDVKTGMVTLKTGTKPLLNGKGYLHFIFKGKTYRVNRLVWMKANHSFVPEGLQVDHINRIRTDNRIENLRLLTQQENLKNRIFKKAA